MSEAERKRRLHYKRKRRGWIIVQSIFIFLVALVVVGSSFIYYQLNQIYYIDYTEKGEVSYMVQLKENEFYEDEWLEDGQAYISTLINRVYATFTYMLDVDAVDVDYEYTYRIDATLQILDNASKTALFDPVYTIREEKMLSQNSENLLYIYENIDIDYDHYNDIATRFVETYGLKDTTASLIVRMHINVIGNCKEFQEQSNNSYTVALNIPLTQKTLNIEMTSSVPTSENKVLACSYGYDKDIFLYTTLGSGAAEVLLVLILIIYAYATRNEDINYTIKVKRLLSAYRSYIQQINGEFDTAGYQLLAVNTFTEMLGIRDTIQSPILMSENEDKTRAQFIIPTNTKILYLYEIKVDDYDEIYTVAATEERVVETTLEELAPEMPEEIVAETTEEVMEETPEEVASVEEQPIIVEQEVDEVALAEALAAPDVELDDIDFVDEIDEDYEGDVEHPGVEVIGVVWPEKEHRNKIYRYDPNGEVLDDGDVVLVPTRDAARGRDVIRKAAVAHANHKIDPETLQYPLKKIIGVVRHHEHTESNDTNDNE